jgi:hypothetical protein
LHERKTHLTKELRRLYDDPIAKLRKADEGARKKSLTAQVSVSGTGTSLTSSMLKYETLERSSVTAPMSKRTIMRG